MIRRWLHANPRFRSRPGSRSRAPIRSGCLGAACRTRLPFEQVGGFDERLFMYGEDVDLELQARRLRTA